MAGDWIPMRLDLSDDPAVLSISTKTGLDEFAIIGRLHRLWGWANRHLQDGVSHDVTSEWVDLYVRRKGFAEAMVAAGWLVIDGSGIAFPKFDEWNSKSAKKRLTATKRQQKKRIESVTDVTTLSRSLRDTSVTNVTLGCDESVTREEKRRVEKKKTEEPPNPPAEVATSKPPKFDPLAATLPFDSPQFRSAWGEWVEYRRVRKPALSEQAAGMQLKALAELTEPNALAAIQCSISNQYQGLVTDRFKAGANGFRSKAQVTIDEVAEQFEDVYGRKA